MSHRMAVALVLSRKPIRIEFHGVRIVLGVRVNRVDWNCHQRVLLDDKVGVGDFVIFGGLAE